MPFNITNSIQVYDDSSMNPPEYEQARCSSHFLTLIFHTQPTLLIIFGFLANLFSFVVLTRPRLRRRPTFSYLAFLSLSNSFLSLIHASFTILGFYFGLTLDNLSLFIFCRFLNRFAIDFLTHFSLYTLTAVDLDRVRTVTSATSNHRNSRSNGGRQHGCAEAFIRVCLIELFLAVVLFLLNIHWLIAYGYTASSPNGLDERTFCTIPYLNNVTSLNPYSVAYNKYLTSILPIIELIVFNILPVFISLLATIVILRHVSTRYSLLNHINQRLKKSRRRMELHLSILLISLNCVFILFTTPHNIYSVYIGQLQRRLVNRQKSEEELCSISILQKSLDLLQQCYFMSTFFLYILTNKRFREEFWDLIKTNLFFARKIKKRENSSTEITTRRRHHRHRQSEIDSITQLDHVDQRNQSIVESPMSIVNDFTQDDVEDE
ncbi:unnamed protein product [Rotaria socialis]|uniref:G-protein coupled receptors family 1 profile domain-containing protein n=1 Tax=Rotaria socialis TaxID=392032 RepID=A0A817N4A9_9BILA|nr:unnamed protein product [Rotaria socialis]CAF3346829.1 unnamed protein product [Rotaria socialis]CAF3382276.1 unnamed protein product [Rotaria socialis]CAF3752161.1 unnamed protein product [Rotaria socialis]CAF4250307.1 unnamed protein product [Rotaria socialis]